MESLIQLIYCSAAQVRFERDQLVALLDVARRKNRRYGVTGMLLFTEGSFFQVLEGPPESVDAIFESISRDDRHDQVTVIIREAVPRRSFEDWTMGFADLQPDEADAILETLDRCALSSKQIVLEVLEREIIEDYDRFLAAVDEHRASGLQFAIDDFGSGHAGLSLLAHFQPDFVKLDMDLIRGIDGDDRRRVIVEGMLDVCRKLALEVIAEGVETEAEVRALRSMGVRLFQGYYFARPAFRAVAAVPPERLRNG